MRVAVIGRSPRTPGVYHAFGHQHPGLALSAITGRMVAALARGRRTEIDMLPYRIGHF